MIFPAGLDSYSRVVVTTVNRRNERPIPEVPSK